MLIISSTAILSIRIDSLDTLKSAYMPFLKNGGLFLPVTVACQKEDPSRSHYKFQDCVCLLLQLLDDSQRHFCITKIAWITPAKISSDRAKGIGLHFDRSDSPLKLLIESKLSTHKLKSSRSQTL